MNSKFQKISSTSFQHSITTIIGTLQTHVCVRVCEYNIRMRAFGDL